MGQKDVMHDRTCYGCHKRGTVFRYRNAWHVVRWLCKGCYDHARKNDG